MDVWQNGTDSRLARPIVAVSLKIAGSSIRMEDRESLVRWRRERRGEYLRPGVERYGAVVFSCALKRLGSAEGATEATRAAFLATARRRRSARKLERWLLK